MKKILIFSLLAALLLTSCSLGTKPIVTPVDNTETETTSESETVSSDATEDDSWRVALEFEPYDYVANDLTQLIKLGEYKGLTVTRESDAVTDEEYAEQLDELLNSYADYTHITDRAVEEGDYTSTNYAGYLNGELMEGGSAEDAEVCAADSSGYIDGFGTALIGKMPGEEFSFDVVFPEDYQNESLQGANVTFVCTVNFIYGNETVVPELTDEFVSETFNMNNVAEFEIAFRESLQEQKTSYVEQKLLTTIWETVLDSAEVLSYPEDEVARIYALNRDYYEQTAESYQVDYDTFLASYAQTTDEEMMEASKTYVKEDLVMNALYKELNLSVTDEEYEEGLNSLAESVGMTVDQLKQYYGDESLNATVRWQKLVETLLQEANVVSAE